MAKTEQMSKLEQIISEIEEYIASCKTNVFNGAKITVNKDKMEELVRELKLRTPEEIRKYKQFLSQRDAVLEEAQLKAEMIISEANIKTEELLNQNEIMQKAYERANMVIDNANEQAQQIVDDAVKQATQIKMSAIQYTDELLANLQMIVEHSIEDNRSKYEGLLTSLNKNLSIIVSNRNELKPSPNEDNNGYPDGRDEERDDTVSDED